MLFKKLIFPQTSKITVWSRMDLNRILSTSEESRIFIQPRIKMNKLHSGVFSHSDVNDAYITPYMQVVNITGRTTCRTTMDSIYTTYNMSLSMWHANIPSIVQIALFSHNRTFYSFSWKQFLPSHNVSCLGFPSLYSSEFLLTSPPMWIYLFPASH